MRSWSLAMSAAPILVASAVAQDVLHYRFDERGGRRVVNYAAHTRLAPAEGTIFSNAGYEAATLFDVGVFGTALRGSPIDRTIGVDTGWSGAFSGSMSLGFFIKQRRHWNPNELAILFRGGDNLLGQMRAYNGGSTFLLAGYTNDGFSLNRDIHALTQQRWVHIAFVHDALTRLAQIYLDGVLVNQYEYVNWRAFKASPENFLIGAQCLPCGESARYDIDEFRLSLRAVSAAEIKDWVTQDLAADGRYGARCAPKGLDPILESNRAAAGPPRVGNLGYRYEVYGPSRSLFVLGLGSSRTKLGALPLPLDLGFLHPTLSGCLWESSIDIAILGGLLNDAGAGVVPAPIPNDAAWIGASLWNQSLMVHALTNAVMTSNAWVTSIGK